MCLDDLDRVHAGAEALRHPAPRRRVDERVDDHVRKRHVAHQLEAGEDHPVLPEPDDVARGRVQVARVEGAEVGRVVGPAERRERPERGREPGVEHVVALRQLVRAALGAGLRLGLGDREVAVGALPDRQAVAPPDLARDVPVGRLLERRDREAVLRLGMELDAARAQSLQRRLLQLVHPAPPLQRDPRLDPRLAAVAERDRVAVRLALVELVALAEPVEDPLLGFLLREPGERARLLVHPAVWPDHRDLGEFVVTPDLVVLRVVTRRDLERAGPELDLDPLVRDHRHPALDERHDDVPADHVAVTLVAGVHGHGDVREDRRGAGSRDRDRALAVRERVAHVGERVVDLDVRELEIREGGEVEGAPVDDAIRAVEPALVPEVDEEPHHGADVGVVHGEALAPVVE